MIQIIPAIDLIDGKCVRLTHGDFSRKTIYSNDPFEVAKRFEAIALKRLHIVDLDGAKSGKPVNLKILGQIAGGTSLKIDFGGGIKTEADLMAVFAAGATIANIGSLAVREPETFLAWVEKYGGDRMLLGADAKDGMVAIDGWQTATDIPVVELLRNYATRGVANAFVTDIGRDGAMNGPSIELYRQIVVAVADIKLIASGGVRSTRDIDDLQRIGCAGVIIGKAIFEGHIKLEDLAAYAG